MHLPGSLIPGGDLRGQSLALHFTDLETEAKKGRDFLKATRAVSG